jgi:hypothetical protein
VSAYAFLIDESDIMSHTAAEYQGMKTQSCAAAWGTSSMVERGEGGVIHHSTESLGIGTSEPISDQTFTADEPMV